MAVLHRAWSFDSAALASRLDRLLGRGEEALRRAASEALVEAGGDTLRALRDLRFDPSWLGTAHEEEHAAILLAAAATPLPSLSSRFVAGYLVLRGALPDLGWTPERTELLVVGRPLNELFPDESPRRRQLAGLSQYGGYLSPGDVESLAGELASMPREAPPNTRWRFEALAQAHRLTPGTALDRVLRDAREMLETARRRGAAVLSILD